MSSDKILQVCSSFLIPNKPIRQPCFSFTEWAREDTNAPIIHICAPCAYTCFGFNKNNKHLSGGEERHDLIDILADTRELKKPFVCGCKGLKKTGHKCYWQGVELVNEQQQQRLAITENGGEEQREEVREQNVITSFFFGKTSKNSANNQLDDASQAFVELAWKKEARAFLEDIAYSSDIDNVRERTNATEYEALTQHIRRQQDLFEQYFDDDAQNFARRAIPISKLIRRAKITYENEKNGNLESPQTTTTTTRQDSNNNENNDDSSSSTDAYSIYQALADPSLHDHILKQLLHWFKNDFFKWVDQPLCPNCNEKTVSYRPRNLKPGEKATQPIPIPEEKQNWAHVIELYQCENGCTEEGDENQAKIVRFPRYNRAKRLLTWRKGRCGEWANCFALCCISLGFETRYVMDLTDHVWVEVFSSKHKRWVHVDPCENAFDAPLMYEKGWGKKLNYVFAISRSEIVDVTRRYSEHPVELETRTRVSELTLSHLVRGMNWFANKRVGDDLNKYALLEQRAMAEREELSHAGGHVISGEDTSGATNKGRQSGSSTWTKSRGESRGGSTTAVGIDRKRHDGTIGPTSAAAASGDNENGISDNGSLTSKTMESISIHAENLFSQNDKNFIDFYESALILSSSQENSSLDKPKWLWKGGKSNVVSILPPLLLENEQHQQQVEKWYGFRFASGSSCQLIMNPIPERSHHQVSSSSPTTATSLVANIPPWTIQKTASVPNSNKSSAGDTYSTNSVAPHHLFVFPSKSLLNSPTLPVPFSAERFTTVVDEFTASLWFTPYFSAKAATEKFRGITGFCVGKTFRVDVSWEFAPTTSTSSSDNDSEKSGELTTAVSIRHIDLPMMSTPEQQTLMKNRKWSENFSSVEAVGIWDAAKSRAHVSSSASGSSAKQQVSFKKMKIVSSEEKSEPEFCFVYNSSSAMQLFASLDKQGAISAIVYQRSEKNEFSCSASAGSLIPVFLIDRGAVQIKVHGLETMVESMQIGW